MSGGADKVMPTPTVHLNGTDRRFLVAQRMGASNAARKALAAVRAAAPDARDYVGRLECLQQAMRIHRARCEALETMMLRFEEEAVNVDQAGGPP